MTDIPLRLVDQPTFDAIECNRCGDCCTRFWLNQLEPLGGPLGFLNDYAANGYPAAADGRFRPQDDMLFFGQLVATDEGDDGYTYACGHFERDADGLGVCTVYDQRPSMCSEFPYGRPQTGYGDHCAWNVALLDYEVVQGVTW